MYVSCTDMQEIFLIKMILYNVYQSLGVYQVLVLINASTDTEMLNLTIEGSM